MLVTVVVLAILASISIKVIDAKEKAYVAVMISNLRILVLAQAAYFDENYQYAPAVALLEVNIAPDVRLLMLGGPRGFTARAMHIFNLTFFPFLRNLMTQPVKNIYFIFHQFFF